MDFNLYWQLLTWYKHLVIIGSTLGLAIMGRLFVPVTLTPKTFSQVPFLGIPSPDWFLLSVYAISVPYPDNLIISRLGGLSRNSWKVQHYRQLARATYIYAIKYIPSAHGRLRHIVGTSFDVHSSFVFTWPFAMKLASDCHSRQGSAGCFNVQLLPLL